MSDFQQVLAELEALRESGEKLVVAVRRCVDEDPPGRMVATYSGHLTDLADHGARPYTVYWAVFDDNRFGIHLFAPYGVAGRWIGDAPWELRTFQLRVADIVVEIATEAEHERREAYLASEEMT